MSSKEEFKNFVRTNPALSDFVNNGSMTWQKFYDMFSLYGTDNSVWNEYLKKEDKEVNKTSLSDIIDMIKKIDTDSLQKNITTINKALGLIGTLIMKDESTDTYTPRPLYKKFED